MILAQVPLLANFDVYYLLFYLVVLSIVSFFQNLFLLVSNLLKIKSFQQQTFVLFSFQFVVLVGGIISLK